MEALDAYFLENLARYGPPILGLALLLKSFGVPMVGTLAVLSAGAFARQGVMSAPLIVFFGVLGAILGDNISYVTGQFAGGWMQRRFSQSSAWQKAKIAFERHDGLAIYLTRFLLPPLAIPTNLIAGESRYPLWQFQVYDAAGQLTWLAIYGGIGYSFGRQQETILHYINDLGYLMLAAVLLDIGAHFLAHSLMPKLGKLRFWR